MGFIPERIIIRFLVIRTPAHYVQTDGCAFFVWLAKLEIRGKGYFGYPVNGSRPSSKGSGSNDEEVSTGKMSGRNLRPLRNWFEVQRLRTRPRPTRPKARRRSVEGSGVDVTVTLTKP